MDRYSAELNLDLASDAIRDEVGQDIDQATTTETYDGIEPSAPYAHVIFLRQVPVTAVSGVVNDGVTMASGDYEWSPKGWISSLVGPFSSAASGITVTYTHGWASGSRELATARGICLQLAARGYVNPGQVGRISVGQVSRDYGGSADSPPGRLQLSEYEKRRLDPLRR